jgi:hypothetical protein
MLNQHLVFVLSRVDELFCICTVEREVFQEFIFVSVSVFICDMLVPYLEELTVKKIMGKMEALEKK